MAGLGRRSHYRKHLTDSVLHDLPEPDAAFGERIAKVVSTRGGNMFDVIVAAPTYHQTTDTTTTTPPSSASSTQPQSTHTDDDDTTSETTTTVPLDTPLSHHVDRTPQLALLPTKFRKLVWLKRNDYVIVRSGDEETDTTHNLEGGVRYMISKILYKDQVKHLKTRGLWPKDDASFADDESLLVDDEIIKQHEEVATRFLDKKKAEARKKEEDEADEAGEDYVEEEEEIIEHDDSPSGQGGDDDDDNDGIVYGAMDPYFVNTNRLAAMKIDDSSDSESSDDE
jgi:probable RNA-binding protein EIF1AD